jgi:diaminopimelate epimerase
MEGSGNDFLVGIGSWAERLESDADLARRACDRRRGVGADGAIAIHVHSATSISMVYRNADGGEAEFCANGTRCAAKAAVEELGCDRALEVITGWATIPAEVRDSGVSLVLPRPEKPAIPAAIGAQGFAGEIRFLTVGVPHLVVRVSGLTNLDLTSAAPPLRGHPEAGPSGANVNFYEIPGDGVIAVRSWERGVEGETLSCGSGLVAVALVVMADHGTRHEVVRPASGDELTVEALGEPSACATRLTGPARFIGEIRLSEEFLAQS